MPLHVATKADSTIIDLWNDLPLGVRHELMSQLAVDLGRQVAEEAYEQAAVLRDAIQILEGKVGPAHGEEAEGLLRRTFAKVKATQLGRDRTGKVSALLSTPLEGSGLTPNPGTSPGGGPGATMALVDQAFREGRIVQRPLDPFSAELLVGVWDRAATREAAIRALPPEQQKLALPLDHALAGIVMQWAAIATKHPDDSPRKTLERWCSFAKTAVGELRRAVADIASLGYNDDAAFVVRTWVAAFSDVLAVLVPMVNRQIGSGALGEPKASELGWSGIAGPGPGIGADAQIPAGGPESLAGVEATLKAVLVAVARLDDAAFSV